MKRSPHWGILVTGLLAACDGQRLAAVDDLSGADLTPPVTCTNDQPATCPSPLPSYQNQVGALLQTYCAACHSPSGVAFDHVFETYSEVISQHGAILNQINACNMPPPDGGAPLPEADRKTMVTWLACGAPNN